MIFGKSTLLSSFNGTPFLRGQSYSLASYNRAELEWTDPLGVANKYGVLTFRTPLSKIVLEPDGAQTCFEIQTP